LTRRERGRGPGLVVVLQEPGRAGLEPELGVQVPARRRGVEGPQPVVEPLVVRLVEPELLEIPLQVPVRLGQEQEIRVAPADGGDRPGPEGLVDRLGRVGGPGAVAPGPGEDLRQHEHCHVAAQAVAGGGDPPQLRHHRVPEGGVAVVQLERVGPAREVRVAAAGQHRRAPRRRDPAEVAGFPLQVLLGALDVIFRVLPRPAVVRRRVVGDEVEHQLHAAPRQPRPQPPQGLVAAEVGMDDVIPDREGRPGDVVVRQVGQDPRVLREQVGVGARDRAPGRARLPDPQEPDPVEAQARDPVQRLVGDVVECGRPPRPPGQLAQPDTRIDLVERGIEGWSHCAIRA
jgi:hypothetical protein